MWSFVQLCPPSEPKGFVKFAALLVLLKCCTNRGVRGFWSASFPIQSYFNLKFVLVCGHVPPSRKVLDWVSPWPSTYCTKYPKYPRFLPFLRTVIRATVLPFLIFLLNTLRKLPVLDVQFVLSSTAELTTYFILCPSIEYVV